MEIMSLINLAKDVPVETVPNWMVIVLGMGTVFVGLICIVVLCKIMGYFFTRGMADTTATAPKAAAPAKAANNAVIENRGEIIAAVTAACAEEMGKDVSAIRVISFKKI